MEATSKRTRIVVVDDHPVVRAGMRIIEELASDMQVVGEAATAEQALAAASAERPDVVLLDIRMEGNDRGLEICRQIKKMRPETRVLFVTSYADEELVLEALAAGADGYLLKESDTRRLVDAIRELMRGESVFDPKVTRALAEGQRNRGANLRVLTNQETRLLAQIAEGRTDKEAAEAMDLTPKTVRNYLERIFAKLNVRNRTEAALLYVRATERGESRQ